MPNMDVEIPISLLKARRTIINLHFYYPMIVTVILDKVCVEMIIGCCGKTPQGVVVCFLIIDPKTFFSSSI
jgi:hypothetical protein